MRRKLYFTSLLILLAISLYAQYIPDVLGDGYLASYFSNARRLRRESGLYAGQEAPVARCKTGGPVYSWLQRLLFSEATG